MARSENRIGEGDRSKTIGAGVKSVVAWNAVAVAIAIKLATCTEIERRVSK